MKLYLLRHEERGELPLFDTGLTDKGFNTVSSSEFQNKLLKLNIDCILSSPFLRCIQTIYWYCVCKNNKINIDNTLYEYLEDPCFENDDTMNYVNYYNNTKYKRIINEDYKSLIPLNELKYPENKDTLNKRVSVIVDYIKSLHSINNLLIVSHQSILHNILDNLGIKYGPMEMGDLIEVEF